ncbi:hypothetical protein LEN26_008128 [Aphanomyces euteiches]|nr:hypothetical protein LEN26_008128 [Aphanomyces euteiches]
MEEEYGLRDLATLPLLEQVHRLLHAIAMKYPYKETTAWKTLPLNDKRRILQYIKDNKPNAGGIQPKAPPRPPPDTTQDDDYDDEGSSNVEKVETTPAPIDEDSVLPEYTPASDQTPNAAADPYLASLKKTTESSHGSPSYNMQWKVVQDLSRLGPCACGITHESSANDAVLTEVKVMMVTFGDIDPPCETTAKAVQAIVKRQIRAILNASSLQQYSLLDFTQLFPDEAMYYGRWKDFKSQTKDDEEPDDDLSDDLVDELDMFASYENMELNAFQKYFLERMKFADKRTRVMDQTTYLDFSRKRTSNFMQKVKGFLQWLELPPCSKASLEFLNFVVYNKIGRLVEETIKRKHQGQLAELKTPLMEVDVTSVVETEPDPMPPQVLSKKRKDDPPPSTAPAPRLKRLR